MELVNKVWEFHSTGTIIFGENSIRQLDDVLRRFRAGNVLIITDPGIKGAGIADRVRELVAGFGYNVAMFDQAVPEPPVSTAIDCFQFATKQSKPDVIIGLGGGSSIDLAKVVALLLAHGGHPRDYFGEHRIPGPIAPLIAIPTTAGTGSEVTSVAVLTDTENDIKVGISDNYLRPAVALLDPVLTVGLPPYVTACSGIDALSHAIEAYTAKDYRYVQAEGKKLFQGSLPVGDSLALQAIELIAQNLVLAVQQGSNLEARSNMLLGSLLAGLAFSNIGTAAAHALAYPIGGLVKSPHGELTGLLLPYVMKYNSAVQPAKMAKIAQAFGKDIAAMEPEEAPYAAVYAVFKLLEDIGLPTTLSQIGIKEENIPEIAAKSLEINRLIRNNPRVPTQKSLELLLREAL